MKNFLRKCWKTLTYTRIIVLNGAFLLLVLFLVIGLSTPALPPMPDQAPLYLRPSGVLVDQLTYDNSLFELLEEKQEAPETLVRDIVLAINSAIDDPRITGLVLNLNGLQGGGVSKLEEIGQALDAFKASGKPIHAYADHYTQAQYYLASHANHIYVNKMGAVALTGFGMYRSYYKEATDKLALKFHVFRVGNYKDAIEPYIRNSMSDASREHNRQWINELWTRYTSAIETRRELEQGTLQRFIGGMDSALADISISHAQLALNEGLVDQALTKVELRALMIDTFGSNETPDSFNAIDYQRYLAEVAPVGAGNAKIGLIVARGTIVDGYAGEGQIGGESLSELIRQATRNEALEALVIRVDSGGGSAFASEVIRNQILNARAEGLPVYISMGSVAASGGYWIASAADEIWATSSTITGSIGVWGLLPNISDSLKKLGIHSDGISTTPLADSYNINRPLSSEAQRVMQSSVENIYQQFLERVAKARDISVEEVHDIAQGRVWTGETAKSLKLVDELGSLDDTFAAIATKLNLEDYSIELVERALSPKEQFIRALMEGTSVLSHSVAKAFWQEAGVNPAHLNRAQALLGDNGLPQASLVGQAVESSHAPKPAFFAHCLSCGEL